MVRRSRSTCSDATADGERDGCLLRAVCCIGAVDTVVVRRARFDGTRRAGGMSMWGRRATPHSSTDDRREDRRRTRIRVRSVCGRDTVRISRGSAQGRERRQTRTRFYDRMRCEGDMDREEGYGSHTRLKCANKVDSRRNYTIVKPDSLWCAFSRTWMHWIL